MIHFPQTEGRAANLDLVSIYTDPFIICVYIGSTPFFVGLYQAFKLLNLIDANKAFSQDTVNTFRNIKFASISLIGSIALTLLYIRFAAQGDDPAGPTGLGIIVSFVIAVIATIAAVFQRLLQNAVDIKSENDLTV
jgi:spore maturation protein SpmA